MEPRRNNFLVVGAGGHGRVVGDLVRALGHRVVGFVDDDVTKFDAAVDSTGARVLSDLNSLLDHLNRHGVLPAGADHIALGIGDNARRLQLFNQLRSFCSRALIHPSAVVSSTARLDDATVVFANVAINPEARIGKAAIVNTGAIIEHDCILGDSVHVSPGAVLCGTVTVGDRTWIGAGAVVIQGRSVGSDCMVGAAAVVLRDIPDGVIAYGNPARVQMASVAER